MKHPEKPALEMVKYASCLGNLPWKLIIEVYQKTWLVELRFEEIMSSVRTGERESEPGVL